MARPRPLGEARHHLNMIRRMAKAVGVDVVEARLAGNLPQDLWANSVTRCRGCEMVEACEAFLDTPVDGRRPVPGACPNAPLLKRLVVG